MYQVDGEGEFYDQVGNICFVVSILGFCVGLQTRRLSVEERAKHEKNPAWLIPPAYCWIHGKVKLRAGFAAGPEDHFDSDNYWLKQGKKNFDGDLLEGGRRCDSLSQLPNVGYRGNSADGSGWASQRSIIRTTRIQGPRVAFSFNGAGDSSQQSAHTAVAAAPSAATQTSTTTISSNVSEEKASAIPETPGFVLGFFVFCSRLVV